MLLSVRPLSSSLGLLASFGRSVVTTGAMCRGAGVLSPSAGILSLLILRLLGLFVTTFLRTGTARTARTRILQVLHHWWQAEDLCLRCDLPLWFQASSNFKDIDLFLLQAFSTRLEGFQIGLRPAGDDSLSSLRLEARAWCSWLWSERCWKQVFQQSVLSMTGSQCHDGTTTFIAELGIGTQKQEALGGHELSRDHSGLKWAMTFKVL
mmetsp:Transcript_38722/g.61001  ORF Transcript_38722/g.61001 Transcript_38722/m.61001 type:complete len:208 (+) Transcript_38722:936-1559(+)